MKEPIIVECGIMLPKEMMKKVREDIIKQVEDGVVILPPGLKLVSVDVSMLEKIKEDLYEITDTMGVKYRQYIPRAEVIDIIDKYISELKGE